MKRLYVRKTHRKSNWFIFKEDDTKLVKRGFPESWEAVDWVTNNRPQDAKDGITVSPWVADVSPSIIPPGVPVWNIEGTALGKKFQEHIENESAD